MRSEVNGIGQSIRSFTLPPDEVHVSNGHSHASHFCWIDEKFKRWLIPRADSFAKFSLFFSISAWYVTVFWGNFVPVRTPCSYGQRLFCHQHHISWFMMIGVWRNLPPKADIAGHSYTNSLRRSKDSEVHLFSQLRRVVVASTRLLF